MLDTEVGIFIPLFHLPFLLAFKTLTRKPVSSANSVRGSETCLLGLLMSYDQLSTPPTPPTLLEEIF